MLTFVKNDLHNIARRLKLINRDYYVFFNHRFGRYEVHNSRRPCGLTLCFIVPYERLDERVLEYARLTRIENVDDIEAQQEAHNATIEQSAKKRFAQSAAVLADMMQYAAGSAHEVVFCKNSKWF